MRPPAPADSALVFDWEKPHGLFSWLPIFVFISVFAHAGTFFLFQVIYPERATIPPAPPEISVLLPSEENQPLVRWIEAENPALIGTAQPPVPPGLVKAEYRPSYDVIRTAPRGLAEPPLPSGYPSDQSPLDIIRSAEPKAIPPSPAQDPQPITLDFSSEISARAPAQKPPLNFTKSPIPLAPARFLIGVTDRGEARFVFPQQSSGDPAIDTEAAAIFTHLAFSPNERPITWGFATFHWGDAAYSPAK